jgi:glycosyltransferase involved in cell wall biosynthesis
MPILYQSADAFLHCSKDESFGSVFAEAMACGLPIVAHDMRRVRWIVGDDEFLVDTDDAAAVAASLERARHSDAGEKSRRIARAKDFSWVTIAENYRHFFAEVLAESKHSRRSRVDTQMAHDGGHRPGGPV